MVSIRTTIGALLEEARDRGIAEGWLYLPKVEPLRLDTPCMFVTDFENENARATAKKQGFEVESLNKEMIEDVVRWATQFKAPPDAALLLEGFVYYWKYDAFPNGPGAGAPPPWEETRARSDRDFYHALGVERPHTRCRIDGCANGTIEHSVLCRAHHFEMIKKRPCPFRD